MIATMSKIERIGIATYRISLETNEHDVIGEFVFEVRLGAGEVEVITWDSEFSHLLSSNSPPLHEMFSAILAFHHAQAFHLPSGQ
jgi:hypothetical protein